MALPELGVEGPIGAALIAALALTWNEWRKRQSAKQPDELVRTEAVKIAAEMYGDLLQATKQLVVELKAEVADLRTAVREAEIQAAAADSRADIASLQAARNVRNIRRLRDHVETCTSMMRAAGLQPPPDPRLEPD